MIHRGDGESQSTLHRLRRWAALLPGIVIAMALVAWLLHGLNVARVGELLRHANVVYIGLLMTSVLIEYALRAWKWGQVLSPIERVSSVSLFAAYMAGFVPGLTIGLGSSVVTRSWLVARRAKLATSTVLASVAVDRLIDAFVFVGFIILAAFAVPAQGPPAIAQGLRWGGPAVLSLAMLALVILLRQRERPINVRWLPPSFKAYINRLTTAFSQGIAWPIELRRRALIVVTSVLVRLLSASQLAWAGAAVGVWLSPLDYIVILVLLGTWMIVGLFMRVPGSGLLIAVFVLQLFGPTREQALAMTLLDTGVFFAIVGLIGFVVLWREGIQLRRIRHLIANEGP